VATALKLGKGGETEPAVRALRARKEQTVHRFILAAALVGLCGTAQAREPLARPMERTPSIMVDDRAATPRKATRPSAAQTRRRATRIRAVTVPRPSTVYETDSRAINRSISESQQRLQAEQRQQVDTNLFRQE
jgi:predicted component of type VI protein secretion system